MSNRHHRRISIYKHCPNELHSTAAGFTCLCSAEAILSRIFIDSSEVAAVMHAFSDLKDTPFD